MHTSRVIGLVVLTLAACKGRDAAPGGGGGSAAAGSARAAPTPRATLDEADVRGVVTAWLAAQNAGDFPAYEALYATRMDGVKRAKGRTWRFDRDGWMADRKRMFAQPMKVEASDVTIARIGSVTAEVELIQSFAQGTFTDEGPKHLLVVSEGGVLRIAREEMLVSRTVAPYGETPIHLIDGGSGVYLATESDWDYGTGPRELERGDREIVTQPAGRAPAELAAWRGKRIDGYAADGTRCALTIGDLYLKYGLIPHFMTRQDWDGHDGGTPFTDEEIMDVVMGTTPYLLGAVSPDPWCRPVFATTGGPPRFFAEMTADPAVVEAAVKAFRRHEDYRAIQTEFEDSYEGKGPWTEDPSVRVFGGPDGPRYVWASATAGRGCGDFLGELWVLWRVGRTGRLVEIPHAEGGHREPVALFDSNGDGAVEVLAIGAGMSTSESYQHYMDLVDGELTTVSEVYYPNGDCEC